MTKTIILRKPLVKAACTEKECTGVMMVVHLSRLEEGLGHEGHECDRCRKRVKYVPPTTGEKVSP